MIFTILVYMNLMNQPEKIQEHVSLQSYNGYRLPAKAKYYYQFNDVDKVEELKEVCEWARHNKHPLLLISWGTNGILAFDEYPWLVIHIQTHGFTVDEWVLEIAGGHMIWEAWESLENDLEIPTWHRFIWLPGSVAWAIYGNAGCFWLETENTFLSCRTYDIETGDVVTWLREDMNFSYRFSQLKTMPGRHIIIDALFDLNSTEEKYPQTSDNIAYRNERQPKGNSCGSFFKNPSREQPAGLLLEECGLKWKKIWWAYFSDLHANFLLAEEGCIWQDLVTLQQEARDAVFAKFWITLENEVQIIEEKGGRWE